MTPVTMKSSNETEQTHSNPNHSFSLTRQTSLSSALTNVDVIVPLESTAVHSHDYNSTNTTSTTTTTARTTTTHIHGSNPYLSNNIIHNNSDNNEKAIHDAARVTSWNEVLELCASCPQYASYKCDDGLTALHHACSRRCPNPLVIQALIRAYPEAIKMMDYTNKGWTPLHHACRFKLNKESVWMILNSYKDYGRFAASVRDKERGRTALYYALRYDAPDGVVELLLEAMERKDILDIDRDGTSVLGLVWDRWANSFEGKRYLSYFFKIKDQWKEKYLECHGDDSQLQSWWEHVLNDAQTLRKGLKGKMQENWNKVDLILRGAFRFPLHDTQQNPVQSERTWRILHAIAAIKCHETLSTVACVLYPEQAREMDENDLFAMECKKHSDSAPSNNRLSALHIASKAPTRGNESKALLEQLLLFYPDASCMTNPADGSLPLHYLCGNEWKLHWVKDGIQIVYEANPNAVLTRDNHGRTPLHRTTTANEPYRSMNHDSTFSAPPPAPPHHLNSPFGITALGSTNDSSSNGISSVEDSVGSIVQNILQIHPEAAAIPDNDGKLPLHSIAELVEDWDANVQSIYDAYPEAMRGPSECLPLHLVACNSDAKPRLIETIVDYYPEAASVINRKGCLALHLACETGKSWKGGLQSIYNAYPEAIHTVEENNRRWTPLHCAVSNPHVTVSVVEQILNLDMNAAHAVDSKGRTPFHLGVVSGRYWNEGGLDLLFQANPDAIELADVNGHIPLIAALLKYSRDTSGTTASDRNVDGSIEKDVFLSQLNTIYKLIRSSPHVLHSCI